VVDLVRPDFRRPDLKDIESFFWLPLLINKVFHPFKAKDSQSCGPFDCLSVLFHWAVFKEHENLDVFFRPARMPQPVL